MGGQKSLYNQRSRTKEEILKIILQKDDFLILTLIHKFINFLNKIADFLSYFCNFSMVFLRKIEIFFTLKTKSRNRLF